MSQINDALKRAQDIQTKSTPSSVSPMLPVQTRTAQPVAGWAWPVAIILFLLLLASLYVAVSPGRHGSQRTAADPAPAPAVAVETAPAPPVVPVAPAASAPAAPPAFRLQGIVYDPVHPYAIISGKTVYVGDTVDGQRVTAISRDAITLAANGQTRQLQVGIHRSGSQP